jgi:integrase
MPKRGENIYKRKDKRWEGRYIKSRTATNKIVYGYVYGKSYRVVKQKLEILKVKHLELNSKVISNEITFSEWLQFWFTTKARNQVKKTTYSSYYRLITKHIIPYFDGLMLNKMELNNIQEFINYLEKYGLSAGTIRNIFSILNKCLSEAKIQRYIYENPCADVVLPKNYKKEVKVLTLQQQRKIEMLALKESWCSPIILALYSGLRVGEISGLKWQDIDFENNIIKVRRTVSRVVAENSHKAKTELIEGTPKSKYSIRDIPLAKNLKKYLIKYKQQAESEYVISKTQNITEPRIITYRFKRTITLAGLENINFHVLRHTFATRCIENGIDIASVSKILGHQSIKMTLDTYTGSLMDTRRKAMNKLDKLLDPII